MRSVVSSQLPWNLCSKAQCITEHKASMVANVIIVPLRSSLTVAFGFSSRKSPICSPVHAYDNLNEEIDLEEAHNDAFEVLPIIDQVDEGRIDYQIIKQMFDQMQKLEEESKKQQSKLEELEKENFELKSKLVNK